MKDNLFQRIFARKSYESLPRTRRLSLESLENRELLNVDWGGFGAETVSEYTASSSSSYTVDLQSAADYCCLGDFNGDKTNELVAFNYSEQTATLYSNKSGAFSVTKSQKLDAIEIEGYNAIVANDFDGDGAKDVLVVSSNGMDLTATLYKWNASSKSFVQGAESELNVSSFFSSGAGLLLDVSATTIQNGNALDLVVQVQGLDFSSDMFTKTAVYSGIGTGSFGADASIKSAVVGELMGSTKIDGVDYLLLKQSSKTANTLVLGSLGSTYSSYSYDLSGYGNVTFNWVVEQDGFLVVGAQNNGASGLITIKSTTPIDGTDASTLGTWVKCDSLNLNHRSVAAIGNVGGDSSPEVFVANGSTYAFYSGKVSESYQYEFSISEAVVTSPEYLSVFVGDVDGDPKTANQALLAGAEGLYVADVDDSGKLGDAALSYKFTQPIQKAVFGDFNGDGLTDFAVQYKANVGLALQVFQQLSDGSFVAIASRSVGTLLDVGVGRFSQTSVDELVVLAKTGSSSKPKTSVYTYRLSSTGSSSLVEGYNFGDSTIDGASITVGSVYGNAYDDVVIVNTSQDTISVLKNTGSRFSATTVSTNFNDSAYELAPNSVAIGDFNGDGLNDVAALNSSAGSNYANVVYYLRSEGGIGSKPSGMISVNGTTAVDDLRASDFNSDGYADLAFVKKSTSGSSLSVLMGNGSSSVFDSAIDKSISLDPESDFGTTLARVDSGNLSADFVWAQGKKVGVLLNNDTTAASGEIRILCRSLSSEVVDSMAEALASQREWIDEWSYFYMDVWASTCSSDAVTELTASLEYNSNYFALGGVVAAEGYVVESTDSGSSITVSAEGSAAADDEGWTFVARVKFVPAGSLKNATEAQKAGVPIPSDGVFASVDSGFGAQTNAQSLNGSAVDSVETPAISLFPFVYDIDDNGVCDTSDFSDFKRYFGVKNLEAISGTKYVLFDYDGNGKIDLSDFSEFKKYFGRKSTQVRNFAYASEEPGNPSNPTSRIKVSQTSSLFDDAFVADVAAVESVEIAKIADVVADSVLSTSDVAEKANDQSSSDSVYKRAFLPAFSTLGAADELDVDVDVDLNVAW